MKLIRLLTNFYLKYAVLCVLTSAVSLGAVIYDSGSVSLASSSPIQHGRLSRNNIPSDWSAREPFPGILNPSVSYSYSAYQVPVSPFPYLQISIYDETNGGNVFASAYANSYAPTGVGTNLGLDTNYLGDAGNSFNLFGSPRTFQVVLSNVSMSNLVVVVNDTSIFGGGVGQPFDFLVEGFYDTSFNDTAPAVPEPSSLALSGAGLICACVLKFSHRKEALSSPTRLMS